MRRLWRKIQLLWHRIRWGFPEQDLWALDVSLAKWLVPRLRRFKQIQHGYPIIFNEDDGEYSDVDDDKGIYERRWNDILDKIILAFEYIAKDDYELYDPIIERVRIKPEVEEGLRLFHDHYFSLWS